MKTKTMRSRGFTLVELLVVIAIIATLAGIATPMILNARKAADRTQAVSNAKQVGLAMIEFEQEFGSFPDQDTAQSVQDATGTALNIANPSSANDFFRQLLAYGLQSEDIFFAKTTYTRKPDNNILGPNALEAGEVGFGYVTDQNVGLSTAGNPGQVLAAAPLLDAQANWTFDRDAYAGKAVILKLDNSVSSPTIRESDNRVTIGNGMTLESVQQGSVWSQGMVPTMRPPLRRGGGN